MLFACCLLVCRTAQVGSSGARVGQVVDVAITESIFNMLESCVAEVAHAGYNRQPSGSTISGVVPSGTFATSDGHHVVVGGNGDSVYSRLMEAIGRPDMAANSPCGKYATNTHRVEREQEIMDEIAAWIAKHTERDVLGAMSKARVPAGPILSAEEVMQEPQYIERGMIEQAPVQSTGELFTMPAILPVMAGTPGSSRWAGPELGEHTEEVLKELLGMSSNEVQQLRSIGAI
eukprot:GHRR01023890.1.p1 GENE.GHRR01023890.1~~GHRR01023890.1.p1  ORF type:complete len:232 (+),score=52.74 GHRR01023890.1:97-792(+)